MCGRFSLSSKPKAIAELLDLADVPELSPRYNIAPTQQVAAVGDTGKDRHLALLRWGLTPAWKPSLLLLNAKAETVAQKPSFRESLRRRRCLIPADGFFEWQKVGTQKQPYHFHLADGSPFAFAGIWEESG